MRIVGRVGKEKGSKLDVRRDYIYVPYVYMGTRGGVVVEALRYKPEGRGIDSRWCHWNFSLT
jgi:hypothetical protein